MTSSAAGQAGDLDAILARIRAELGHAESSAAPAVRKQRDKGIAASVPFVVEADGLEDVPAGPHTIESFEALDEDTFLRTAYRVLLGRDVDQSGRVHFLPALRDGRATAVGILGSLRWSPEGVARGVDIPGLRLAWFVDRAARAPYAGRIVGPLLRMATRSRTIRRLQRRIAASDLRHREAVRLVNGSISGMHRGFTYLEAEDSRLEVEDERLDSEVARVETLTAEARALAQSTLDGLEGARIELAAARRMIAEESRKLAQLIEEARAALPAGAPASTSLEALGDPLIDSVYLGFENKFRGSVEEISRRQARYLDMFRANEKVAAGGEVLDIGCGRGEWLTLLKSANISARGIDLNPAMAAHTRSLGLDVMHGDALAHLKSLPEGSLAAVTGFHIVEHLGFHDLLVLLGESFRALAAGGIILFETPNPENLVVGACTFNYDPTHNKPLPPDLLRFLAESRGFDQARIIRTDADCQLDHAESGFKPTELNDWFRQPADYALYARKPDTESGPD